VSGGIAAYKACELVRLLTARGARVVVVMTEAATQFVTPLTFQALSGNPVVTGLWGDQAKRFQVPLAAAKRMAGRVEHIDLAEACDALVIAPATADLLARLVHGEAPDALTALALACRAPLVVCPALDAEMWRHPATRDNLAALRRRGARVLGPDSGPLASGLIGPGRLVAPEVIADHVTQLVAGREALRGLRVLIGAGRTEEALDPVRVLTNRSSGRMGVALAEAARDRGARVTLVLGPADLEPPSGVEVTRITSARELHAAMIRHARRADLVVMAAAVADYRPARPSREKLKRGAGPLALALEPNPDILKALARARRPRQVLVGFALETSRGVARARAKLRDKHLDLIVLNAPSDALGKDTNRVTLIDARRATRVPTASKRAIAEQVLARALELRVAPARKRAARRT